MRSRCGYAESDGVYCEDISVLIVEAGSKKGMQRMRTAKRRLDLRSRTARMENSADPAQRWHQPKRVGQEHLQA